MNLMTLIISPNSKQKLPFLAVLCGIFFLAHCAKIDSFVHPEPTQKLAELNEVDYSQVKQGWTIYKNSCAHCHQHQLPKTSSLPDWHVKVKEMSEKATLTPREEKALQAYLELYTDV